MVGEVIRSSFKFDFLRRYVFRMNYACRFRSMLTFTRQYSESRRQQIQSLVISLVTAKSPVLKSHSKS